MNGPPIQKLNILHYAKAWVEQGHMYSDQQTQGHHKKRKIEPVSEFVEENEEEGLYYVNTLVY